MSPGARDYNWAGQGEEGKQAEEGQEEKRRRQQRVISQGEARRVQILKG